MFWTLLIACGEEEPSVSTAELEELQLQLEELEGQLEAVQRELAATESPEIPERYTDEEALAVFQGVGEWYLDNRRDPPGSLPSTELIEGYHETTECEEGMAFADCNATGALKFYVNGPRITDNDWSEEGLKTAALRSYHTHTSGLYMVSFGVLATVSDYGQLIPPSGLHLEPHGAHQGLRIDGTANAADNIRVDLADGATGLAVYSSGSEALYCADMGRDCSESYPLYLRGGRVHLEDIQIERSVDDLRLAGIFSTGTYTLRVKRLIEYSWDEDAQAYAYCHFHRAATAESVVLVDPYGLHERAFEPRLLDTWGADEAPEACTGTQTITTEGGGTYGYGSVDAATAALPGFRVVLVDLDGPIDPADFVEDYPVVSYELIEPI